MCTVLCKHFVCADIQSTATVTEQPSQQQPAAVNNVDQSAHVPVSICAQENSCLYCNICHTP